MREAHAHIAAFGESLGMADLSACASVEDCLRRVADAAGGLAPGAWVRGLGVRVESWTEPRWPTAVELEAAAGGRPCVLMSFDFHGAVGNLSALRAAGLKAGDVVPPKGMVVADPSGGASGLLVEHAAYRVWDACGEPTRVQRREFVLAAMKRFSALGFTEVHDLLSQDWLGPLLAELNAEGHELPRAVLYPPVGRVRAVHAGAGAWASDRVVLAGGKVFADGTLNSRTALTLEPYREPATEAGAGPCGRAMVTPGELDEAITTVESLGLGLAVHAIGDGAVRMTLDAIERTQRAGARRGPFGAHRIEHCELIDEADVPRFARLGVVCSVQPCHLLTDIEVLERQLPGRLGRVLPLRELIGAGCAPGSMLWFGSDAPIVRPEPEDSIRAAVHRRRAGEPPERALGWGQRIEEAQAWACFGGAYRP
jgi:predicted amidohydrolase YtcJ